LIARSKRKEMKVKLEGLALVEVTRLVIQWDG
jgi:hypothetical protein